MGCTSSISVKGDPEEEAKDRDINAQLKQDKKRLEKEIKLLLLGAGESGKSTIAKQMKIIHLSGFSDKEREVFKMVIYSNVVTSIRSLITAAEDLEIPIEEEDLATKIMQENYFDEELTEEMAEEISKMYNSPSIQKSLKRSAEFQLNDSAQYYFGKIHELAKSDYLPSEQDILRSRAKTTGIIETEFTVKEVTFRMVDVGGQRSERKKWMHCFQDVTAVIFCVAMSEYDLKLYEDNTTNRMVESLRLFGEICNNRWFADTSIILFLNKKDLFAEKIKKIDLNVCFQNYMGGKNYDAAAEYLEKQFFKRNNNETKTIYPHQTCATDTNNIRVVFDAVRDMILRAALNQTGFG